jgi:hypothetical protein
MSTTPNIALTLLTRQQSAKETTINDALVKIDTAIGALQGGGGGGAADGTNRLYHFNAEVVPSSMVEMAVYADQGPVSVARYDLANATTGDDLKLLIESLVDTGFADTVIFVLPPTFTRGSISVDCRLPFNVFLATEAAMAAPMFDMGYNLAQGAVQLLTGYYEYALVETLVEGSYIPKLVSIKAGVVAIETRDFSLATPALNQSVECIFSSGVSNKLLKFMPQTNVVVLSDVNLDMQLEVLEWDTTTRDWNPTAVGDYTWTTDGSTVNFGTLVANTHLGQMNVPGQGSYRLLPFDCLVRIKIVGFPDGAPSYAAIALNLQTLIG